MKKVYVRWLGAFAGREYSLAKSISFEMNRKDEAACEPLTKANHKLYSGVAQLNQVGLIIRNESIFREFRKDCWSFYGQDANKNMCYAKKDQHPDRLYKGSMNPYSNHAEAWAKMPDAVTGFVVCGSIAEMKKEKRNALLNSAMKYKLPIYELTRHGQLIEKEV